MGQWADVGADVPAGIGAAGPSAAGATPESNDPDRGPTSRAGAALGVNMNAAPNQKTSAGATLRTMPARASRPCERHQVRILGTYSSR